MAIILEKQTRRNRVQFTMPRQLFEVHQRNLELAKKLGAIIDFNKDFERWFGAQIEQVSKELGRLNDETTTPLSSKPKTAATNVISNSSQDSIPPMTDKVTEEADGND